MVLLVTGGTGFLGSYLTRYALTEGGAERVVVLDRYADRAKLADLLDRVVLVEGDVADPAGVRAAIEYHGVDRVAHFAFILGSPAPGQMLPYVQVQCLGTANVLEAARLAGVKRLLFASSVAAYGQQVADVLDEDMVPNPDNPYGSAKAWGEALVRHYRRELGLDALSLRFGSTYGLGRAWRGSYASGILTPPRAVHYMARVENAVRGEPIAMPRDDTLADWTYAADAAQAAWLALTTERPAYDLYNVSGDRRPVGLFTAALRKVLPAADIRVDEGETPGNPHLPMASRRLVEDLGFHPKYDLRHGIEDYVARIRAFDRYRG
jgi:nucleoside-diphosphate-sugar epimerase